MGFFKKNKSGYAVFKDKGGKTHSVHKRVVEKKMGGKVRKGFQVHHKDGNKTNNRPSNLWVVSKAKHKKLHPKKKKSFWN
ncbi:HNH endonuclease [archaeon]|jgi:hypothetical protein|nr:HNH endonuclease [archaeon]